MLRGWVSSEDHGTPTRLPSESPPEPRNRIAIAQEVSGIFLPRRPSFGERCTELLHSTEARSS